ncbi:hypothetical protein ACIBG7_43335 [Nonomuraea sp. NPDC050328]|uniref:hypothetical protein n=1 Tax=Nonomuraea sp. NPDC050328 TaxID=3364361 RepID=UPI0037AE0297
MKLLAAALLRQAASVPTPAAGISALGALPAGPGLRGSDGGSQLLHQLAVGRVTSALTNSTTTLADMTGLALPVDAGGVYLFEFSGTYSTSSTSCFIAAGVNGPSAAGTGLMCNFHLHIGVGANTWHNGCTAAFGDFNTPAFVQAANAPTPWRIYGSAEIGATGGLLAPQFARNSGAGTITIQAGAWGWLWRIA